MFYIQASCHESGCHPKHWRIECSHPRTTFPSNHCTNHTTVTNHSLHWLHSWIPSDTLYKPWTSSLSWPSIVLPSWHFRALSCFDYLLPTWSVYPLWLSAACPWPRLPCVYSITCLPPASTLCFLSVYDSVSLRYPWRCYQNCACLTRCTSNKTAHGSQRHWLCYTSHTIYIEKLFKSIWNAIFKVVFKVLAAWI